MHESKDILILACFCGFVKFCFLPIHPRGKPTRFSWQFHITFQELIEKGYTEEMVKLLFNGNSKRVQIKHKGRWSDWRGYLYDKELAWDIWTEKRNEIRILK